MGRSLPASMTVTQDPDMMWPKRRKSDLVVRPGAQYGMGPYTQKRAQKVPEAPAPTSVPIRIIRSRTPSAPQDPMWPRRKKSDLMIYQVERALLLQHHFHLYFSDSVNNISLLLKNFISKSRTVTFSNRSSATSGNFSKKCDFVQI